MNVFFPAKTFFAGKHMFRLALSIFIPLVIFLLMIVGAFYFSQNRNQTVAQKITKAEPTTISGSIDLDGYIPSTATITVSQRLMGQGQFIPVDLGIKAQDMAVWRWNDAQYGLAYDLEATVLIAGKVVAQSQIVTIAAPSTSTNFRIVSNLPSTGSATISGKIDLNGYIPTGSVISVMARKVGEADYQTVASDLYPADGTTWSFTTAQAGVTYEMRAYLQVNGVTISKSTGLIVAAPATNEALTVDSTVTPPAPIIVSVSGILHINGAVPVNSHVVIAERLHGTSQLFSTVTSDIPSIDGGTWIWTTAQSGKLYDLQAYVQVGGATVSQSQIITIAAPAQNESVTINLPLQPPTPSANSMTNTCIAKGQNGLWQVSINYNTNSALSGIQQYALTIGTNSGGDQLAHVASTPLNISNSNQTQTYTTGFLFTEGKTYFAQWAYAACNDCSNFSGFSPSLQFYCQASKTH